MTIDNDDVRLFADLERPDVAVEPERPRAVSRRHPQHVARGQDTGLLAHRLEDRRESHLVEHVEPVVARGAVGAKGDGDASGAHFRYGRDAGAELQMEPGQCNTLTPRSASNAWSCSSAHTQWAAQRCGDARPTSFKYAMFDRAPVLC